MNNRQATGLKYKSINDNKNRFYHINFDSSLAPEIPYEVPDFPQRRKEEYEREQRLRRLKQEQLQLRVRAIHRAVGIERAKSILTIVSLIAIITGLFAFVMIRQSQIIEQNFSNTRLENQIQEIKTINNEEHEELLSQIDLSEIEKEALQLYGLRKPAQSQKIHMTLPDIDRVVRYKNDGNLSVEETENKITFDASHIEAYMKNLRLQE